jgi:hypothetical protein
LVTLALAAITAACNGGGGSSVTPPPPQGNFSNASLKGQYTFIMSGSDATVGLSLARVGSFIADGAGNISMAIEDVNSEANGNDATVTFTGGTYSIQSNGYGTITFAQGGVAALGLSVQLSSPAQGLLIENDLNASSSGSLTLVSATVPATFALSQINGPYVFDVSGVSNNGTADEPLSVVGQFTSNSGNIPSGTVDINDGFAAAPSGAISLTATTYQLDPSANGTTFGRGTLTINANGEILDFVFYLGANGILNMVSADSGVTTSGTGVQQSVAIPTTNAQFQGSFVTVIGGSVLSTSEAGPLGRAARFMADGSGNLSMIYGVQNDDGSATQLTPTTSTSGTYAIDTTHPGSGRGSVAFVDSQGVTVDAIFYMSSATQGFFQDTSPDVIGDGSIQTQSGGPFSASSVEGSYAFNWSGDTLISNQNSTPFEMDVLGQFTIPTPSGQTVSGAMDIAVLGSNGNPYIQQDPVTTTLTVNGDGTDTNTYKFVTSKSPSSTFNFDAFYVSPTQVYLVGIDKTLVVIGTGTVQTP